MSRMQCSIGQVMANPWPWFRDDQNQSLVYCLKKTSDNASLIKPFLTVYFCRLQSEADQVSNDLLLLNLTLLLDEKHSPYCFLPNSEDWEDCVTNYR